MKKQEEIKTTKLKAILEKRGIEQAALCLEVFERTGVFFRYPEMSLLVNGRGNKKGSMPNPTIKKAAALAFVLGVSIDDICEYEYE